MEWVNYLLAGMGLIAGIAVIAVLGFFAYKYYQNNYNKPQESKPDDEIISAENDIENDNTNTADNTKTADNANLNTNAKSTPKKSAKNPHFTPPKDAGFGESLKKWWGPNGTDLDRKLALIQAEQRELSQKVDTKQDLAKSSSAITALETSINKLNQLLTESDKKLAKLQTDIELFGKYIPVIDSMRTALQANSEGEQARKELEAANRVLQQAAAKATLAAKKQQEARLRIS